jgi:ferredoxin
MPWVEEAECTGCGICVSECPVDTIYMENKKAVVDMENCIHCAICHQVCPTNAVKHDSEKIPDRVTLNVQRTKAFMDDCARYLEDEEEKGKCLNRMIRHFRIEKVVAEKTLSELEALKKEI